MFETIKVGSLIEYCLDVLDPPRFGIVLKLPGYFIKTRDSRQLINISYLIYDIKEQRHVNILKEDILEIYHC